MSDRITGHDIHAFKVACLSERPEPYFTELGYGPYHDVIARLVNQATALGDARQKANSTGPMEVLRMVIEGVMVSLGEVLADRIQDRPRMGDGTEGTMTQGEWNDLCCLRAAGYLEWLKPLLEQKREETQ